MVAMADFISQSSSRHVTDSASHITIISRPFNAVCNFIMVFDLLQKQVKKHVLLITSLTFFNNS